MRRRKIHITDQDLHRLEELLAVARSSKNGGNGELASLEKELRRAKIVEPERIPPDVVTMNSKVKLRDVDTGEEMTYTLVFPHNAEIDAGRLSILSPVGTAILGYSTGDVIEWAVPKGTRRIKIEEIIYQPEAQGHYPL